MAQLVEAQIFYLKVLGSNLQWCQLTVEVASLSKMLNLSLTLKVDGYVLTRFPL